MHAYSHAHTYTHTHMHTNTCTIPYLCSASFTIEILRKRQPFWCTLSITCIVHSKCQVATYAVAMPWHHAQLLYCSQHNILPYLLISAKHCTSKLRATPAYNSIHSNKRIVHFQMKQLFARNHSHPRKEAFNMIQCCKVHSYIWFCYLCSSCKRCYYF